MNERNGVVRVLGLLLALSGCVGGASNPGPDPNNLGERVVRSDGTPGGDLVEQEMLLLYWWCEDDADPGACWDDAWPEDATECMRSAVNNNLETNELTITCVVDAHRIQTTCLDDPWVIPATCMNAFQDATGACPAPSDQLRWAIDSCPSDPWKNPRDWAQRERE